jgi:hypothetical protein
MADPSGILNNLTSQVNNLANSIQRLFNMQGMSGAGYSTSSMPIPSQMQSSSQASGFVSSLLGNNSAPDYTNADVRFGATSFMKGIGKGVAGAFVGGMAMLPTAQEAMSLELLAGRQSFYNPTYYGAAGSRGSYQRSFEMQRGMSNLGLPTSPLDAAAAMNYGAGAGLSPALGNYNPTSSFGGVMGGAALASNLSPGLGITGGVGVMASMNNASTVNSLRMMGINIRSAKGDSMRDLPDIIQQFYNVLKQAAGQDPTPQMIAVSLMSGNSLDSMLDQFFGNDQNTRETIVAGLYQMANTKGSNLATSGTRAGLLKTGGLSSTVNTLSKRNTSELSMLQAYTGVTNAGTKFINQSVLPDLYNAAIGMEGLTGPLQSAYTGLEVFNGARNGAGQMITGSLFKGVGGAFGGFGKSIKAGNPMAQLGAAALVGAGVGGAAGLYSSVGMSADQTNIGISNNPNGVLASGSNTSSPTFTGAITINVTVPAGADPYQYGNAVRNAMNAAATT